MKKLTKSQLFIGISFVRIGYHKKAKYMKQLICKITKKIMNRTYNLMPIIKKYSIPSQLKNPQFYDQKSKSNKQLQCLISDIQYFDLIQRIPKKISITQTLKSNIPKNPHIQNSHYINIDVFTIQQKATKKKNSTTKVMDPNQNYDNPNTSQQYQNHHHEVDMGKLTEVQNQLEFRRKRQEYIAEKLARKKQLLKQKQEEFGLSSSEEQEDDQEESIQEKLDVKETQSKQGQEKRGKQATAKKNIIDQKQIHQIHKKKLSDSLEKINITIHSNKGNQWTKDFLIITQKTMTIQNMRQQIKNIVKIKIVAQPILGSPFRIKINSTSNQQYIIAATNTEQKMNLPSHYYIFAKLIQQKLMLTNGKLKDNIQEKIPGLPEEIVAGSFIYGKIGKKSQVLGNWEERLVVINKEGIFSYRKYNQKYTMHIAHGVIKEMWTRFQIQDKLLIVKIYYSGKKTQFGFPLLNFLSVNSWLYNFYTLLNRGK